MNEQKALAKRAEEEKAEFQMERIHNLSHFMNVGVEPGQGDFHP